MLVNAWLGRRLSQARPNWRPILRVPYACAIASAYDSVGAQTWAHSKQRLVAACFSSQSSHNADAALRVWDARLCSSVST